MTDNGDHAWSGQNLMYTYNASRLADKTKHKRSNAQRELNTHINVPGHLHNLGEIHSLLSCGLQVLNRENLQSGIVDLVLLAFSQQSGLQPLTNSCAFSIFVPCNRHTIGSLRFIC